MIRLYSAAAAVAQPWRVLPRGPGLALRRVTGNELSAGEASFPTAADRARRRCLRPPVGPEGGAPPPAQPSHILVANAPPNNIHSCTPTIL
jgi:hypothetical protein